MGRKSRRTTVKQECSDDEDSYYISQETVQVEQELFDYEWFSFIEENRTSLLKYSKYYGLPLCEYLSINLFHNFVNNTFNVTSGCVYDEEEYDNQNLTDHDDTESDLDTDSVSETESD